MDRIFAVDWIELFAPTHSLAEMFVRGTLMYLALFLTFRFIVQRQSSAIGIADLLVIVIIADAAQNAFSKEYRSVTEGIVLVLTIVCWDLLLDWLGYKFHFFTWLVKPGPVPLVRDGKMIRANMRRELISVDELLSLARQQGIGRIEDVRAAALEGNGEVSFVKMEGEAAPKSKRREKAK